MVVEYAEIIYMRYKRPTSSDTTLQRLSGHQVTEHSIEVETGKTSQRVNREGLSEATGDERSSTNVVWTSLHVV
jgi:hypothetical protein